MGLHHHTPYIINFSIIDKVAPDLIGKKAHQIHELIELGIPIPDGFIIKTCSHVSPQLLKEIHSEYKKLCGFLMEASLNISASFLNDKILSYSNIEGDANLIHHIKKILKSPSEKPVNIIVQKNIQSKVKGKIFTKDPHSRDKEKIVIMENNSLATYYVSEDFQITYKNSPKLTKKSHLLDHKIALELAQIGKKLHDHFYFPQVIDFVIKDGKIFISDVKPLTHVHFSNILVSHEKPTKTTAKKTKTPLLKGISVNPGIVTGMVKVIHEIKELDGIKPGEIIAVSHLYPFLFGKIRNAKGVVSNSPLQKDKDKMLYRNFVSVPTVSSTKNATKALHNGNIVTVNGTSGEVYLGGMN